MRKIQLYVLICIYVCTQLRLLTRENTFSSSWGRDVIECDLFNQTCSMEQILVRKILAIWTLLWPFGPVRIDAHVMQTIVDYMQRNVSRGQQYVSIS